MDRQKMREMRKRLGLNQQEFGVLLGCNNNDASQAYISALERGVQPLSNRFKLLLRYLDKYGAI